jgi:hypothetical protein
VPSNRVATLRAALGFLQLQPRAPELRLLFSWLDNWTSVGLVTVGVEPQGHRLSLTHVAEGEWQATFAGHPLLAPVGYGMTPAPWGAVHRAAWAALE